MIKVVAFDLDDTLWSVDPVLLRAERVLQTWLGEMVPTLDYDAGRIKNIREELIAQDKSLAYRLTEQRRLTIELVLETHLGQQTAQQLSLDAMEVFLTARNQVDFFQGALETIAEIATSFQLGALTNGNADIARLGLSNHFSFAFSAEEVGAPKPEPDLFHHALSHLGCDPHEMVYVGDDPIKDVDAANSVGLATIWVRGEKQPDPGKTRADQTIEDIRELPAAIRKLVATPP